MDVTSELYTIQMVGSSDKIDAFISTAGKTIELIEVVRSGVCGIARGERALRA